MSIHRPPMFTTHSSQRTLEEAAEIKRRIRLYRRDVRRAGRIRWRPSDDRLTTGDTQ